MSADSEVICLDRRANYGRREDDVPSEKCAVHDELDRWYNFRWEQQDKKIDVLQKLIERQTDEMIVVRRYLAVGMGFLGAIQIIPHIITILEALGKR